MIRVDIFCMLRKQIKTICLLGTRPTILEQLLASFLLAANQKKGGKIPTPASLDGAKYFVHILQRVAGCGKEQ